MPRDQILAIGIFGCALLIGGAILYHRAYAPAACDSAEATDRLQAVLRDGLHFQTALINDVQTVSGTPLGSTYTCTAEIAEVPGIAAASELHWRVLDFTITRRNGGPNVISARLGDTTTLNPPEPSFWQRLRAHL